MNYSEYERRWIHAANKRPWPVGLLMALPIAALATLPYLIGTLIERLLS